MKKFTLTLISFLLLSSSVASAKTLLVLDMRNGLILPHNFRTTSQHLPDTINKKGLEELHIAGGAEFSKESLKAIAQNLRTKNILVVDLRQESHGLLNSNAISWYAPKNAENEGKTPEKIDEDQFELLSKLGEQQTAIVNNILKKSPEGKIEKVKPIEYLVHQTSTEQELVTGAGLKYKRIYVQDFNAPTANEVDRFLEMTRALPEKKWIYFHCRAGVGRTTTFMMMYDMLKNAKQVSFEDILARQVALGGKDITQLPHRTSPKFNAAVERMYFIKQFYEYARTNADNFATSWSDWIKTQA